MPTVSSALLRQARRATGLTQRALAAKARVPQPSVARVEAGARDLNVETLDTLLRSTGHQLIVVPTRRATAAAAAVAIGDFLTGGDHKAAFREVIQLSDDLARSSACERVVLAFSTPPTTGDRRYDNLIAGLVENYLAEAGAPTPSWLDSIPPLDEPWHIDPYTSRHPEEIEQVPTHLRWRNVILDRSELASA